MLHSHFIGVVGARSTRSAKLLFGKRIFTRGLLVIPLVAFDMAMSAQIHVLNLEILTMGVID